MIRLYNTNLLHYIVYQLSIRQTASVHNGLSKGCEISLNNFINIESIVPNSVGPLDNRYTTDRQLEHFTSGHPSHSGNKDFTQNVNKISHNSLGCSF